MLSDFRVYNPNSAAFYANPTVPFTEGFDVEGRAIKPDWSHLERLPFVKCLLFVCTYCGEETILASVTTELVKSSVNGGELAVLFTHCDLDVNLPGRQRSRENSCTNPRVVGPKKSHNCLCISAHSNHIVDNPENKSTVTHFQFSQRNERV